MDGRVVESRRVCFADKRASSGLSAWQQQEKLALAQNELPRSFRPGAQHSSASASAQHLLPRSFRPGKRIPIILGFSRKLLVTPKFPIDLRSGSDIWLKPRTI